MSFLILVRHGQSLWNIENRFTGWVDIDLAENGRLEAKKAGLLIQNRKIKIDIYYSSLQLRANRTLEIIQKVLKDEKDFTRAWQLNERHYGALTGLNKSEMGKMLGENKILEFRRSWDIKPDDLSEKSPYHPKNIETYKKLPRKVIPNSESLKDTYQRVLGFFNKEIKNKLIKKNVLISAHGNSIRALCKYLLKLDHNQISKLEIPTGNPLIIEINNKFEIKKCEYLDKERAKDLLVF